MKWFALTFAVLTSLSANSTISGERVHAVSNLEGKTVIVEVWGKAQSLLELNVETGRATKLVWPKDIRDEEIMGLLLRKDKLFVIAQWTKGQGKNPSLHEYDRGTATWKRVTTFDCISFDQVELTGSELQVECEADPRTDAPAKTVRVALSSNQKEMLKLTLPVFSGKQDGLEFSLEGEIFNWKDIRFGPSKGPQKSLTAADLAKIK